MPTCDVLIRWLDRVDAASILRSRLHFETSCSGLVDDENRGCLVLSPPKHAFRQVGTDAGFVFWFPDSWPMGSSILLASSRIGLQPETKSGIFDAIRTVACRFDSNQHFLITHSGLSTDRYITRSAELYDLPLLVFRPMPADIRSDWFRDILNLRDQNQTCYYGNVNGTGASIDPDRLLVSMATEVRLLAVRSGGKILEASQERLAAEKADGRAKTLLLMNDSLTSNKLTKQLIDAGAVPWWLYHDSAEVSQRTGLWSQQITGIHEFASRNHLDDYLIHWTRRRTGRWPDQSENQFLDDLILGLPASDHSRIATLIRIVATKQLLANNEITRDSTPVVCFSECSVDELPTRRQFRSHLNRWDFESVGIAVNRNVLAERGAQPVVYGDNATWQQLSTAKRPYFQLAQSETMTGDMDWTAEREWRLIGNLDLSTLPFNDVFVYVENADEAEAVARFSRWQVVVLSTSFAH